MKKIGQNWTGGVILVLFCKSLKYTRQHLDKIYDINLLLFLISYTKYLLYSITFITGMKMYSGWWWVRIPFLTFLNDKSEIWSFECTFRLVHDIYLNKQINEHLNAFLRSFIILSWTERKGWLVRWTGQYHRKYL